MAEVQVIDSLLAPLSRGWVVKRGGKAVRGRRLMADIRHVLGRKDKKSSSGNLMKDHSLVRLASILNNFTKQIIKARLIIFYINRLLVILQRRFL